MKWFIGMQLSGSGLGWLYFMEGEINSQVYQGLCQDKVREAAPAVALVK